MLKPLGGASPTIARPLGVSRRNPPRLISRVWLYGPTDGGATPSRTVTTPTPSGATYLDARAIGGGGGSNGSTTKSGGGAAYARAGIAVSPRASVVSVISGQAMNGAPGANGVDSTVSVNGVTFVKAAAGKGATAAHGAGGLSTDCIGTTIVAGTAGDGTQGGPSGSDAAARDPLNLGGYGRFDPATARDNSGALPPVLNDIGSGGFPGSTYVPALPTTTAWTTYDGRPGGAGIVVLEFWSKKPT